MTRPVAGLPDALSQSEAAHTLPYPVVAFSGSATQPAPDASSIRTHWPTEKLARATDLDRRLPLRGVGGQWDGAAACTVGPPTLPHLAQL